jgi:hypothetical protein
MPPACANGSASTGRVRSTASFTSELSSVLPAVVTTTKAASRGSRCHHASHAATAANGGT